jgi:hypothetical protein
MEDVESGDAAKDRSGPGDPIREASTATDEEDAKLVYDHTLFQKDKVRRRYFHYYHGRMIIVERGAIIKEFDECTLRVRAVMDSQGWTNMVEDHCPTVEEIVWELYVNLYQRHGNSFHTWLTGTTIEVTLTLISTIIRAPLVCDPTYPWPINHLPACADMVACFAKGRPHQIELDGEGSLQMSDLSNDVRCICHILVSQVLPIISHMLIAILFLSHFHDDVDLTFGQGICIAVRGPDHSDRGALQGSYDRVEGDLAREGIYGCTLPQRKLSSLVGGKVRAEGTATADGSLSWWDTC